MHCVGVRAPVVGGEGLGEDSVDVVVPRSHLDLLSGRGGQVSIQYRDNEAYITGMHYYPAQS